MIIIIKLPLAIHSDRKYIAAAGPGPVHDGGGSSSSSRRRRCPWP